MLENLVIALLNECNDNKDRICIFVKYFYGNNESGIEGKLEQNQRKLKSNNLNRDQKDNASVKKNRLHRR